MQNVIRKRERREARLPSGSRSLGSWSSLGKFQPTGSSMGSATAKRRGTGLDCIELGVELISPDAGALVESATISLRISFHDGGRLANSFFSDIAASCAPDAAVCRRESAVVSRDWSPIRAAPPVKAEIIPAPPRLHMIDLRKL